ncbi:hypothetical protein ACFXPX_36820 [Kitasatospora sp. NPDC059146]|uniref:hypothetical protein n=1 Tax=unclassified Kitasatospora TaxID=2633591 RepID=UPI0036D1B621
MSSVRKLSALAVKLYHRLTKPRMLDFTGLAIPLFMYRYTVVLRIEDAGTHALAIWAATPRDARREAQQLAVDWYWREAAVHVSWEQWEDDAWLGQRAEHLATFRGWHVRLDA